MIRNPVPGIQNPRLSWIPLHGATKGKTQKDTKQVNAQDIREFRVTFKANGKRQTADSS